MTASRGRPRLVPGTLRGSTGPAATLLDVTVPAIVVWVPADSHRPWSRFRLQLRQSGWRLSRDGNPDAVMANNNPETVRTDHDLPTPST